VDGPAPGLTGPAAPRSAPSLGRLAVLALLVAGLVVGGCLVITGGGSGDTPPTTLPPRPTSTLPLGDLSLAGVEALSGIDVPDGAQDFLSARLDGDRQLDVSFTLAPDQVDALVTNSDLPPLADGARVILHSSPLWKLNPGTPLSGAADVRDGINRAVEVTPEGDRIRVRLTLQAA
jgi:hypothetical protein